MGWQIFTHSLRLVWANLGVAFRISAVLYIVSAVFQVLAQTSDFGAIENGVPSTDGGGLQLISTVVSIITSLWIAVAWHRYILLEEVPEGLLPNWHGARMMAYFGRSLLIGLTMLGVILLSALPMLAGIQGVLGSAIITFGAIFSIFLFYRLCAVLPSAAMGEPLTLAEAGRATEGNTGTIVVLVLCMIGGVFLLMIPAAILAPIGLVLSLVYMIGAQWFMTMFGISIFTTFYGHFIEKRELG